MMDATINADPNCEHPTLPEHIVRNFMSYTTPGYCRNQFTPEQAQRMRIYLESAPVLQSCQIKAVNTPTGIVSGNIVVNSGELIINTPLEMLPGATIRVKPGAKLRIESTITGACGQMWQGIIVEGKTSSPQTDTNQGVVSVAGSGKLEHAHIAIDVQDTDAYGEPVNNTGGGIVRIFGGQLVNNCIGVRFGPYASPGAGMANTSQLLFSRFSITDNYRGGMIRPVFMDLSGVVRLSILYGCFLDLRSQCSSLLSRAIGIDSKNAGIRVSSGRFENLRIGARVSALDESTGSFTVSGSTFIACRTGVESVSTSGFSIQKNNFIVKKPDVCPSSSDQITGAYIRGNTTGFLFSDNDFSFDGTETPSETLVGTECSGLKGGLNNKIDDNTYSNMSIGNRARGLNSDDADGLLYVCNENSNIFGLPSDFRIEYGAIKNIQADFGSAGENLPTGNVFSNTGYAFENFGAPVEYYYDANEALQNPNTGIGFSGINPNELPENNPNCAEPEPCNPCPHEVVDQWKARFHENRMEWLEKKAELPIIIDPLLIEEQEQAIRRLRLEMNRYGGNVLRNYGQDTAVVYVDSLTHWLQLLETYQTGLRLARHYFFTRNYLAFQQLWEQLESKYELSETELVEFQRLGALFDLLYEQLQAGYSLNRLSENAVDILSDNMLICDEAGYLSQVILWRNGLEAELDCKTISERFIPNPLEGADSAEEQSFWIFPNPADQFISVEYASEWKGGHFRLCDLYGRVVYQEKLLPAGNQLKLEATHLRAGIYYAEIRQGQAKVEQLKLIIFH